MNILSSLRKSTKPQIAQRTSIGRVTINLPPLSMFNENQLKYKRYDKALGEIANAIYSKYPSLCAIDVGANVGGTAARIRNQYKIPVLCIEGDEKVLEILSSNLAELGEGVVVERSFVGPSNVFIDPARLRDSGINASLVGAVATSGTRLRSMDEILQQFPSFRFAKLFKTDCEGFDFEVLESARTFIADSQPVIFLEYAPTFRPDAPEAGPRLIKNLSALGYEKFLYFDNFGNFITLVDANAIARHEELHSYLLANKANGEVVYYFDICAFHAKDADIALEVRNAEVQRHS